MSIGTLRSNDVMATRILLKSQFAFFQSLSQLFLPTYFVKCRRTLLKLNSKGPYPSSEREIIFLCCLFTFSIKRGISAFSRHSHAVTTKKYTKKHDAHFFFFFFFIASNTHTEKKQKLHRINKVIKRKKK